VRQVVVGILTHLLKVQTDLQLRDSAGLPMRVTGFPLVAFASGRTATPTFAWDSDVEAV